MTSEFMMYEINRLINSGKKPTVPEVRTLCRYFYSMYENSVGGHLHIVLDDGNLENKWIRNCIATALVHDDYVAAGLGVLLLRLSPTQRRKLYKARRY